MLHNSGTGRKTSRKDLHTLEELHATVKESYHEVKATDSGKRPSSKKDKHTLEEVQASGEDLVEGKTALKRPDSGAGRRLSSKKDTLILEEVPASVKEPSEEAAGNKPYEVGTDVSFCILSAAGDEPRLSMAGSSL